MVIAPVLEAVVPMVLGASGIAASADNIASSISVGGAMPLEIFGSGESDGIPAGNWVVARNTTASSLAKRRRCAPKATPSKGANSAVPTLAMAVAEGIAPVEFLELPVALLFASDDMALRAQSARMEEPVTPPLTACGAYL